MRALILVVFSGLFGCDRPFFDLREPIYLVAEDSFWSGCEDDPAGYMECTLIREQALYHGAKMWFKHWDEAKRPKVFVVTPGNVPAFAKNEPIYISIDPGFDCAGKKFAGCYYWMVTEKTRIIFATGVYASNPQMVGHELGHAITVDSHVVGRVSIMSTPVMFYVAPQDIAMLCKLHPEIECPAHNWCEGTFYDEWRCPSVSPEGTIR